MIFYEKIPAEVKKEIKEYRSFHISYGDTDEGDEEDYVYCHRYNRMFGGIDGVKDLVELVDIEKANKINEIIKKIQTQIVFDEDEGGLEVITIAQIKELLDLMEGLDKSNSCNT